MRSSIVDVQTTATIQQYFTTKSEFGSYVVDPHTAVGLEVANRVALKKCAFNNIIPCMSISNPTILSLSTPSVVQIVLATAHPAKFNAAVSAALSSEPSFDFQRDIMPKEFDGLLDLPRRVIDCPCSPEAVQKVISREVAKLVGQANGKESESTGASI